MDIEAGDRSDIEVSVVVATLVDLASTQQWTLRAARENFHVFGGGWLWTIGRRRSVDVTIAHPWISKLHGFVEFFNGAWCAIDGGTAETVTVNGIRIHRMQITSGDILGFGETRLQFEVVATPPPCPRQPQAPTSSPLPSF